MESMSYIFLFRMMFFSLVTTGCIFYIIYVRIQSINQSKNQNVCGISSGHVSFFGSTFFTGGGWLSVVGVCILLYAVDEKGKGTLLTSLGESYCRYCPSADKFGASHK